MIRIATLALALAVAGPATAQTAATAGDIDIGLPYARATLPNQPVGGGYMTLTNTGGSDDRLTAATAADIAGRVEIHAMEMDGDVMRMRPLPEGLSIPAGGTVDLAPGGYHVMFMDLAAPLAEGDMIDLTLTFETGGEVTVAMPVLSREAGGGADGMGASDDGGEAATNGQAADEQAVDEQATDGEDAE